MEPGGGKSLRLGSESQDSDDLQPPGTAGYETSVITFSTKGLKPGKTLPSSSKGVENAKKRLRAFSIQKKSSLSPVPVTKPVSTGGATVFIGKLSNVKSAPKPEPDPAAELKKLLKPPKPGAGKHVQESYMISQKKTLAEIEDMKRQMELVELGIPLGLICPAPNSDKAMPTKAMPPIKSFLEPKKVDELIREAKRARAEGKEFKFNYHKLLPDYDNPFQRKKDDATSEPVQQDQVKVREKEIARRSDINKYDTRKQPFYGFKKRESRHKEKPKERDERFSERVKDRDGKFRNREFKPKEYGRPKESDSRSKERDYRSREHSLRKETVKTDLKKSESEAEVNLKDFVVCDSWSDNEEKELTPKHEEKKKPTEEILPPLVSKLGAVDQLIQSHSIKEVEIESPKLKIKRLNPVIDSFKFEIEEPEDDEVMDEYDEHSTFDKSKKDQIFDSPMDMKLFDYDLKDEAFDGMVDDTFLESVINEIKQEELDETSQDKGLVEYDESPSRDEEIRESVTPEMDDRVRELQSSRSDYSDGYKSESGCKSTESGYKSTDSLKLSESYKSDSEAVETPVEERKMAKYTAESLETWSFVLKICQPLLFRHDKNKCYKETRMTPKLWFTENPKLCSCVKDRKVVYKELEMCKMELVDSLYSGVQAQEAAHPTARGWYPHQNACLVESSTVSLSNEWEAEDSQSEHQPATPQRSGDISLDKEYQRFMEAVWPDVTEPKSETPRSTPIRQEATKHKADDNPDMDKQKPKKMKRSNEGWSQESELEEDLEKSVNKKVKVEKQKRKRKHSTASSVTDSSETEAKKRKKMQKKKDIKAKSKEAKRRRVIKKNIKKLKEKQKKKKKIEAELQLQDLEKERKKKEKKKKKKKLQKEKKRKQKKNAKAKSSSSSSDGSSDSESEKEKKSKKKKKKHSEKKKKRKGSTSESTQEELFDVNILNNIKTERVTDDEAKQLEFSPRKQKPREIINVKELQNDFVGNSIQIKKEIEQEEETPVVEQNVHTEENIEVGVVQKQEEDSQDSVANEIENVMIKNDLLPEIKDQEESQSTPKYLRPDESNLSHIRPDESSLSQLTPNESDLIEIKSEMYNLSQIPYPKSNPDESNLSQRQEKSNLSQIRRDESSLSQIKQEDSNQSQNESTLSQIRPDESNLSQLGPDESNLSQLGPDESNLSQCSSQESIYSLKDQPLYEKDESHLRPSSQNSNYSFHDVMASGMYSKGLEHGMEQHDVQQERHRHDMQSHENDMQRHEDDMGSHENYEHGDYEMYEQMAMAYQSDVASQRTSPPRGGARRIETVVRARTCGEIKCDWRAGDSRAKPPARPSRWGLKPGDVNIVLTGGNEQYPIGNVLEPVYKIQSIANRTDSSTTGYDEAYMDMYGAADKLQYGDCFSTGEEPEPEPEPRRDSRHTSSLDDRISLALRTTVLGEVAKDACQSDEKEGRDKGILVTKSLAVTEGRVVKRVSFADGYKPGQDSDVEEPPVKKKRAPRRSGCPWPCPAPHPDHVPLWDALPPPPPPPGSPPPPRAPPAPPAHLLRRVAPPALLPPPPHRAGDKFDPNSMPAFMPPEPPPGLISFQNL